MLEAVRLDVERATSIEDGVNLWVRGFAGAVRRALNDGDQAQAQRIMVEAEREARLIAKAMKANLVWPT